MRAAIVILALGACAAEPSVSGTLGGRPFDEADAFFDVGTHLDIANNGWVTFTELRVMDYAGACADYGTGSFPSPMREVAAALYTNGIAAPANGALDSSVTAPGAFALGATQGDQAYVEWVVQASSHGAAAQFDGGTITITDASPDWLDGSIDVTAIDGSHVAGAFRVGHCAAADWAH